MKKLLLSFVAVSAWAQTNSFTVTNRETSTVTNYPVQIHRPFVSGEIATYPQALVNGSPVTTQADVRTRWPNGSVKSADVSFLVASLAASTTATVTFQNQAGCNCGSSARLTQAQMLGAGYDFGAKFELTQAGATTTIEARDMLTAGHYAYWREGSIATTIILGDHVTKTYDAGWQRLTTQPAVAIDTAATAVTLVDATGFSAWDYIVMHQRTVSSTGHRWLYETARCATVAANVCTFGIKGVGNVDATGLITITSGDYGTVGLANKTIIVDGESCTVTASVSSTATAVNGTTQVTKIKTNCSSGLPKTAIAWSVTGTTSGRSLPDSHDGAQNWTTARYVSARDVWQSCAVASCKSFRPVVEATFWPTINKVSLKYIGENTDTTKLQNLAYDLVLKTGNTSPATVRTETISNHNFAARWAFPIATDTADSVQGGKWILGRNRYWIGGAPGSTILDYNSEYLKATTLLENFSAAVGTNVAAGINAAWAQRPAWGTGFGNAGPLDGRDFAGGGLDNRKGPHVDEQIMCLYDWGSDKCQMMMFEIPELLGSAPVHFREGSSTRLGSTRYYDANNTTAAIGLPMTPAGRPLSKFAPQFGVADHVDDTLVPVGATMVGHSQYPVSQATIARGQIGWGTDTIHFPEGNYIPYLLGGDHYLYEQLQFHALFMANLISYYQRSPSTAPGGAGRLMYSGMHEEIRGEAWALRSLLWWNLTALDGSVAKTYTEQALEHTFAAGQGVRGVTGDYQSTNAESYSWGSTYVSTSGRVTATPMPGGVTGNGQLSPLHSWRMTNTDIFAGPGLSAYSINPIASVVSITPFQQGYMGFSLYLARRLGWSVEGLITWLGANYTPRINPALGNPFPYSLEATVPDRRPELYSSFEVAVGTGFTTTTDTGSKMSVSSAQNVFGAAQSLAVTNANTTPAYLTKSGLGGGLDLYRLISLFKMSSDFSLSSGGGIELMRAENVDGGAIQSVWLVNSGGNLKTQWRIHTPTTRTVSTSSHILGLNAWYGAKLQAGDADNTLYGTGYSSSLMQPDAYKGAAQYARELYSYTQTLPTTFDPHAVNCAMRSKGGVTATAQMIANWPVRFITTAPAPFDTSTTYYVITPVFISPSWYVGLSATPGGAAICPSATSSTTYTLNAADSTLRNKDVTTVKVGAISFEGTPTVAGTIYFDEVAYVGSTIVFNQTFTEAKDMWPATAAQVASFTGTANYRAPQYAAKATYDYGSGATCPDPNTDYSEQAFPILAALYEMGDSTVMAQYSSVVYTNAMACGGSASNPKFSIVPTGFTASSDPIIGSISPSSRVEDSATFTLTVQGSNFTSNSKIYWGGALQTTTFVSSTSVTASISSTLIVDPGTVLVDVRTSGFPNTSSRTFAITASAPTPIALSVTPLTLNFSCIEGGSNPSNQTVTFTADGTLDNYSTTVNDGGLGWLSRSPGSGTTAANQTVSVDCTPGAATLPAAGYQGTLTVSSSTLGVTNSPQIVTVNLTVEPVVTTIIDLSLTVQSPVIVGRDCIGTVTASGGTGPYTYAVTGGALPTGCALSAAGVLGGTSTTVSPFTFTITATDSISETGEAEGLISVIPPPQVGSLTVSVPRPYATGATMFMRRSGLDANSECTVQVRVGGTVIQTPANIQKGPAVRPLVLSGLPSNTTAEVDLQCGADSVTRSFTTSAAVAADTATVAVRRNGSGRVADNIVIEYGTDPTLAGATTTSAIPCTDACGTTLTLLRRQLYYLRTKYRDAGNTVLMTSEIQPLPVQ